MAYLKHARALVEHKDPDRFWGANESVVIQGLQADTTTRCSDLYVKLFALEFRTYGAEGFNGPKPFFDPLPHVGV